MDFDWDDGNTEHILYDHDVTQDEAMEVFYNNPVPLYRHKVDREWRQRIVGNTHTQRILTVVFILRERKIRVVTAFDAGIHEIKTFWKRRN